MPPGVISSISIGFLRNHAPRETSRNASLISTFWTPVASATARAPCAARIRGDAHTLDTCLPQCCRTYSAAARASASPRNESGTSMSPPYLRHTQFARRRQPYKALGGTPPAARSTAPCRTRIMVRALLALVDRALVARRAMAQASMAIFFFFLSKFISFLTFLCAKGRGKN